MRVIIIISSSIFEGYNVPNDQVNDSVLHSSPRQASRLKICPVVGPPNKTNKIDRNPLFTNSTKWR